VLQRNRSHSKIWLCVIDLGDSDDLDCFLQSTSNHVVRGWYRPHCYTVLLYAMKHKHSPEVRAPTRSCPVMHSSIYTNPSRPQGKVLREWCEAPVMTAGPPSSASSTTALQSLGWKPHSFHIRYFPELFRSARTSSVVYWVRPALSSVASMHELLSTLTALL
jgi:hypothetical protein